MNTTKMNPQTGKPWGATVKAALQQPQQPQQFTAQPPQVLRPVAVNAQNTQPHFEPQPQVQEVPKKLPFNLTQNQPVDPDWCCQHGQPLRVRIAHVKGEEAIMISMCGLTQTEREQQGGCQAPSGYPMVFEKEAAQIYYEMKEQGLISPETISREVPNPMTFRADGTLFTKRKAGENDVKKPRVDTQSLAVLEEKVDAILNYLGLQ